MARRKLLGSCLVLLLLCFAFWALSSLGAPKPTSYAPLRILSTFEGTDSNGTWWDSDRLSQALFVAGAPSAVLTLWNVNDESTSHLMQAMYKGLMEGEAKGEALRQAQLTLLHDPIYHHPYYWAPFVLYGDWR